MSFTVILRRSSAVLRMLRRYVGSARGAPMPAEASSPSSLEETDSCIYSDWEASSCCSSRISSAGSDFMKDLANSSTVGTCSSPSSEPLSLWSLGGEDREGLCCWPGRDEEASPTSSISCAWTCMPSTSIDIWGTPKSRTKVTRSREARAFDRFISGGSLRCNSVTSFYEAMLVKFAGGARISSTHLDV